MSAWAQVLADQLRVQFMRVALIAVFYPLGSGLGIGAELDLRCGDGGALAGFVAIRARPDFDATQVERFLARWNATPISWGDDGEAHPFEGDYTERASIQVPSGQEVAFLSAAASERWLEYGEMECNAAGPEGSYVDFELSASVEEGLGQSEGRAIVEKILRARFGELFTAEGVTPKLGASFEWELSAAGQDAIGHEFFGRWIVTKLRLSIGAQRGHTWRLEVEAPDGYLPLWDRRDPPPRSHVRQFHLDEGSYDDPFTGFEALERIIDSTASTAGQVLLGEVLTPDRYWEYSSEGSE